MTLDVRDLRVCFSVDQSASCPAFDSSSGLVGAILLRCPRRRSESRCDCLASPWNRRIRGWVLSASVSPSPVSIYGESNEGNPVATGSSEDSTFDANEIGTAPPRGRPKLDRADTERTLSKIAGKEIKLPAGAVVTGGPALCPACGSRSLMWGCDSEQKRTREEIHPLVWDDTEWMADSFICRDCQAGWIEPDDPAVITWVRPYWRI
jgi:hypothetical protein